MPGDQSGRYAPLLLETLSDRKPADCVVTADVGQHQMWSAQHMTLYAPGEFYHFQRIRHYGFQLARSGRRAGGPSRRYGYLYLR